MSGRVNELDGERAHSSRITALDLHDVGIGHTDQTTQKLGFGLVDIHLGFHLFEQFSHTLDVGAEQIAAEVILVIVGHQRLGNGEAVVFRGLDDGRNVPGGVDNDRFTRGRIPNQVGEILHGTNFNLLEIEGRLGHHFPFRGRFFAAFLALRIDFFALPDRAAFRSLLRRPRSQRYSGSPSF